MEGMSNKNPCSAWGSIQEHIIENRLTNMSIEGREGILDDLAVCCRIVYLHMVQVGVTTVPATNSSDLAPLVPIECHWACALPEDKLLVDNYFNRGDGEG